MLVCVCVCVLRDTSCARTAAAAGPVGSYLRTRSSNRASTKYALGADALSHPADSAVEDARPYFSSVAWNKRRKQTEPQWAHDKRMAQRGARVLPSSRIVSMELSSTSALCASLSAVCGASACPALDEFPFWSPPSRVCTAWQDSNREAPIPGAPSMSRAASAFPVLPSSSCP